MPKETLVAIAERNGHAFGVPGAFESARAMSRRSGSFLRLFADCCRVFRLPRDYFDATLALGESLSGELSHAEIYISPEIWTRFGLDPREVVVQIDAALSSVEKKTGCRFLLLLDSVRQWGPEAAERVLDFYEERPLPRIAGFGIGGNEAAVPARAFRDIYERARSLGLSTSIHAGEWEGPDSIEEALDHLAPDRIDHGVRAAEDPSLLRRLASLKIPLCVAPSSNVSTGVFESWRSHPLPRLLEAGVKVCLSADDPTLFETTTMEEYRRAGSQLALSRSEIEGMKETARQSRFSPPRGGAGTPPRGSSGLDRRTRPARQSSRVRG